MSNWHNSTTRPLPRFFALTLLLSLLCAWCSQNASAQPVLQTLFTNGPAENRLNIVVLSEGYTSDQLDTFLTDARAAVDKLLAFEPYNEYRNYINAYAIAVPSAQSGSSHLQWPVTQDTYFRSTYDAVEDRILTIPPNETDTNYADGMGKVDALLQALMPQCGLPILLVNDVVAGGSGGNVCIAALGEPSAEFLAHESGHTLAKLGDEYTASRDYASSTDADIEPNTTRETRRAYIKWNAWINPSTPVPTPTNVDADVVGLFQGAHYYTTGWYRPQLDCIMRTMEGTPFCQVCSEALIKAIYQKAHPIDSFNPQTNQIALGTNEAAFFSVAPLAPLTHGLSVQWLIDGAAVAGATNAAFDFASFSVTNGTYTLTAQVADLTPSVRNDPSNLLNTSIVWTVTASGMPALPAIATPPQSQAVRAPAPATFSVIATGSQPLFYQWQHNGTNLPGQTAAALILNPVQAPQAGNYTVTVSNRYGQTTSSPVALTVTLPLSVVINGPGNVITNYNGQWLEVGRTYTMTAIPATGCIFTNWTGAYSTNKARISFVFQPDLVLTANFIDPLKPTLLVASPVERARSTNASLVVTGTASDNAGVQAVQYRLNGGELTPAQTTNNWKNWKTTITPRAGTNVLQAFSVDTVGNQSATVTRHFTYVVRQALTLTTQGTGAISPNLNGKLLEIGQNYAMTALPWRGQAFAGWSSGSHSPSLSFQMQSNLVLQASFETNPFVAITGIYSGLFLPADNTNLDSSGFVKIALTDQGRFTGSLLDGGTYGFSGSFWVDGLAQVTVLRKGKAPIALTLQLDLTNGTDQITGNASTTNWAASLTCDRAVFNARTNPPPQIGRYTLAFVNTSADPGVPSGDGYGILLVDAAGTIRLAGTLADGTPLAQTVSLAKDGRWPFFATLYLGKGAVAGWLQFTNSNPGSLTGNVTWIKTPIAGKYYPAGFTNLLTATGSTYHAVKGTPLFPLSQADLLLSGGNLNAPITNTLAISSNNAVSVTTGTNNVKLILTSSSGLLSGSFINPRTRALTALRGVILQEQTVARGFFLGTNSSGAMQVSAPPAAN